MPITDLAKYRQAKSVYISMGERVALARQNRGTTQTNLGQQLSIDRSVISRWETGALKIRTEDIARVATALHTPDLLGHFCAECPVAEAYLGMTRGPKTAA